MSEFINNAGGSGLLSDSTAITNMLSPASARTEEVCLACNGAGEVLSDAPWLNPPTAACESCAGSGVICRDYLREAFLIVQDRSHLAPERRHLEAVIAHCRQLLSAAIQLPEVH